MECGMITQEPVLIGSDEIANSGQAIVGKRWSEEEWSTEIVKDIPLTQSCASLRNSVQSFLSHASTQERAELDESRNTLQALITSVRRINEPSYSAFGAGPDGRSVRQRFKDGYSRLTETAYHYSQHLDGLVVVAPEYVSLAWGAIKIILILQINHGELKDNIQTTLQRIVDKFEIVDHLPDYMPRRNLVKALADAYAYYAAFLTEVVKYCLEHKPKKFWNDFAKPWKIRFQPLVEQIDEKFAHIKDIAQLHGLISSHLNTILTHTDIAISKDNLAITKDNLAITKDNLAINKDNQADIREILSYARDARAKEQGLRFLSTDDVATLGNMVRQCIAERLEEPFYKSSERSLQQINSQKQEDTIDSLEKASSELFPELHELKGDQTDNFADSAPYPEIEARQQLQTSILRTQKFLNWVEATTSQLLWVDGNSVLQRSNFVSSFAVPLMIDGESNYASTLLLRHFCGEGGSNKRNSGKAMLQSLLMQLFQQLPLFYNEKKSKLSRERTQSTNRLWMLLVECLKEVKSECIFIVIDSIDTLYIDENNGEEQKFDMVHELTELVELNDILIKVLLTARLADREDTAASNSSALIRTTPHRRSTVNYDQSMAMTPFKLLQIQERRANDVLFEDLVGLYLPGSTIYATDQGEVRAFLVQELDPPQPRSFGTYTPLVIQALFIDHDSAGYVKRTIQLSIPQFSGLKAIKDLPYVAAGYLEDEARIRQALKMRGQKFWTLCEGVHYKLAGSSPGDRVMIERSGRSFSGDDIEYRLPKLDLRSVKPLTLILCTPIIDAFFLDELRWSSVRVSEVADVPFDKDPLGNLLVESRTKAVLRASLERHLNQNSLDNKGNIVRSKRQGLIVFLHGPPSSGKRFTVHCLADHVRRAIMYLDLSQLGTEPESIKERLRGYLRLAESWGIIVHFDNFDDFVTRRSINDDRESAILSAVFLRELERFSGVVFLTSARVGIIDERAQRLFTLTYFFPRLTDRDLRTICQRMLKQVIPTPDSSVFGMFKKDSIMQVMGGNARGLQNLISAAVALSESGSDPDREGKLTAEHLDVVVQMRSQFSEYLNEIARGGEEMGSHRTATPSRRTALRLKDSEEEGSYLSSTNL
ncbi:MAG: hypothetical protein M1820_004976 [Bogoriella megaspora]|nr:MAG: hypothetical protein M1820_004976 [Bogoriella megaspora]